MNFKAILVHFHLLIRVRVIYCIKYTKYELSYRLLGLWDLALYGKVMKVNIKQVCHFDCRVGCCCGFTKMLYCMLLTLLHASLYF